MSGNPFLDELARVHQAAARTQQEAVITARKRQGLPPQQSFNPSPGRPATEAEVGRVLHGQVPRPEEAERSRNRHRRARTRRHS